MIELKIKPYDGNNPNMAASNAFHWHLGRMPVVKFRGDPEECSEVGILIPSYTRDGKAYVFQPFCTERSYVISVYTTVELIGTIEESETNGK